MGGGLGIGLGAAREWGMGNGEWGMGNGESGFGIRDSGIVGCGVLVCRPGLSGGPGQGLATLCVWRHAVSLLLISSFDGISGRLGSLEVDPAVRRGRSGRAWLIRGPGSVAQSSRWVRCH
ncbi:hypothetical protein XarbCFBP6827_13885 [Xanthomonas arboricola]|nr:hypothetical protein XarbCFBP6827_13885 [Xanthomonas arboricola]